MLIQDLLNIVYAFAGPPAFPHNLVCTQIEYWPLFGRDCNWHFRIIARARPEASRKLLHDRDCMNTELCMIFQHFRTRSRSMMQSVKDFNTYPDYFYRD